MADKPNLNLNIDTSGVKDFLVNFLVPLICLGISAILGFFVFYPSYKSLPTIKAEVAQKTSLSNQLSTKLSTLQNLKTYKSVVDENSVLVQSVLVDEAMVPQLLTQIDQIAKDSGFKVTKLSYSFSEAKLPTSSSAPTTSTTTAQMPDKYKTVDVSLGTDGNYDQLIAFMQNLENAARLIDVDTFRYTISDKEGSSVLNMNFALKSPYLKIESKAVTDDPIDLSLSDANFVKTINKLKGLKFYRIGMEDVNEELVSQTKETSESSSSSPFGNL